MEEISQFNIPLFSEEQTPMIAKSTLRICVCCLLENVPFVQLSICKHVELFDFFFKVKLEYSESMVCYGCHKLLKDLYQFRQQVQTQSHTELTYIENSKPIQNEKLEPSIVINIPSHEIKTEIKIEPDYSDSENDVPLSEIKQKEVKIKKDAPVKNYEGKVRSVFLSEEEMLEDRMKEAMKEGYLNLPYKCESCITGFDHELTLKEHMEKRHYEVILIFGINGACRATELVSIKIRNIEIHDNMILINLPETKAEIDRSFVIRDGLLDVVKKYINLRPKDLEHNRFFLNYMNGKCTKQPMGRHKIAAIPKVIAAYLNLPNAESYTGHCFRRTSATLLAESGRIDFWSKW
ncbi:hypothetical protein MSG28_015894 [Choristoneura fumiferana]|uniref:Uncharacterized protein n=1 Tax=Choristoneura fumiferana TaxID=7141 RepID=A0ACC0K4P7_CHOFU|nr:hypothetical protein MSG28_015894 [Choristoneura fumiferana]